MEAHLSPIERSNLPQTEVSDGNLVSPNGMEGSGNA